MQFNFELELKGPDHIIYFGNYEQAQLFKYGDILALLLSSEPCYNI